MVERSLLGCPRAERSIGRGQKLVEGGDLGGGWYSKQEIHPLKCGCANADREPPTGTGKLEVECHWVSRAVKPAQFAEKQTKNPTTQRKQEKPLLPTVFV